MGDLFSAESMAEYSAFASRHLFMVGIWVVAFVALIYVQIRIWTANIKKLSSSIASVKVNHDNGVIVDVRPAAFFSKGHIANSINITFEEIKSGKLQRIDSAKKRPVVLVGKDKFDSDTFYSARILKKLGYKEVYTLEGGINQWAMDNLPLTTKR